MVSLALVSVSSLFVGDTTVSTVLQLQGQRESARARNKEVVDYVQELREHVYLMSHDRRFLEQAARNELGMMHDDEIVFAFGESAPDRQGAGNASLSSK
jgi:cell division protein FtsB